MRPAISPVSLVLCLLILGLGSGCGVEFGEGSSGTELFEEIELQGFREAGAELTLALTLNPSYPIPVHVACYYEDGDHLTADQQKMAFQERAVPIGETVLPANPARRPDDDIDDEQVLFRFSVPRAGSYFLACMTPASPENGLGMLFKIGPG